MHEVSPWLAAIPICYYVIALSALMVFIALAVAEREERFSRRSEIALLLTMALVLFAWRWPIILVPHSLNPDEAGNGAAALKAMVDVVPWRGFDPGTNGPLNIYVLALPALLGAPVTYISIRIIATILLALTLAALYYTLKWTYSPRTARLSLIPPLLLLSLTTDRDFVHYSSEYLPICLTTIALAATAYIARPNVSFRAQLVAGSVAAFCAGCTCFSKLQAAPIGVLMFLLAVAAAAFKTKFAKREIWLRTASMLIALLAIPVAIFLIVWWTGCWHDAFLSYIKVSLSYVSSGNQPLSASFFFGRSNIFTAFLVPSLLLIAIGLVLAVRARNLTLRFGVTVVAWLLLLLTALFVTYEPHHLFSHYLLFLIVPLSCLIAAVLHLLHVEDMGKQRAAFFIALYLIIFLAPSFAVAMVTTNPYLSEVEKNVKRRQSVLGTAISRYAAPGCRISIWGWAANYYVESGTVMATSEADSTREINPGPYRNYFRNRYLSSLKKQKPPMFVDAVAPRGFKFTNRATNGHESFPGLAAFISEQYVLKEEVGGTRIFLAKDHQPPAPAESTQ